MTTIGNIGIGLLILIIVWILALVLFVFAVRLQSNLGWIGLGAAALITIILSIIPTEKQFKNTEEYIPEEKDYTIIYKYILLAGLTFSAASAFAVFFLTYCIEPIRAKPIKTF